MHCKELEEEGGSRAKKCLLLILLSVCGNIIVPCIGCKQMKGQKHRGVVSNKSLLTCQTLNVGLKRDADSCQCQDILMTTCDIHSIYQFRK